jgi:hypothetical protein
MSSRFFVVLVGNCQTRRHSTGGRGSPLLVDARRHLLEVLERGRELLVGLVVVGQLAERSAPVPQVGRHGVGGVDELRDLVVERFVGDEQAAFRIRLDVPGLFGDPTVSARAFRALSRVEGVRTVRT